MESTVVAHFSNFACWSCRMRIVSVALWRSRSDLVLLGMAMLSLLMHVRGDDRCAKREGGASAVSWMGWPAAEQVGKMGSFVSVVVAEADVSVVVAELEDVNAGVRQPALVVRVLRRWLWSLKTRPSLLSVGCALGGVGGAFSGVGGGGVSSVVVGGGGSEGVVRLLGSVIVVVCGSAGGGGGSGKGVRLPPGWSQRRGEQLWQRSYPHFWQCAAV